MPNSTLLRYSEVVMVDLSANAINFADASADGHRVEVDMAIDDMNTYLKWTRSAGSDRPRGYVNDISGFQDALWTSINDGMTDLDSVSTGLSFSTSSLANSYNKSYSANDLVMAYVLYKVYGRSAYDTSNIVYNSEDALNMLLSSDVTIAVGDSISSHNARDEAVDQMFRDLLAADPGRFFDGSGQQIPGLFETSTDATGNGSWNMIVGDKVQIVLNMTFQEPVTRRVVKNQQHPLSTGGTMETVTEETIIAANDTFRVRLQVKGVANRSAARLAQMAGPGGEGSGGGGAPLYTFTQSGGVITGYTGTLPANVVIPGTIDGVTITEIGAEVFKNNTTITSIVTQKDLTVINYSAFEGCTNLVSFTIPDMATVGDSAFKDCIALSSSLPESVISIDTSAFENTTVTFSTLPSNITTIGASAFKNCSGINISSFPATLTSVGANAFEGCNYIGTFTFPAGFNVVPAGLFKGCTGLYSLTFTSTTTTIGASAFDGCTALETITIPSPVTTIGNAAFNGCTGIITMTFLSENVGPPTFGTNTLNMSASTTIYYNSGSYNAQWSTNINAAGFTGNLVAIPPPYPYFTLTSGKISGYDIMQAAPSGVVTIPTTIGGEAVTGLDEYLFTNNNNITSVFIPAVITSIPEGAFKNCENLVSVTIIGQNLTQIGDSAFEGCSSLASFTIPDSVVNIGGSAFSGCTALTSITIPPSVGGTQLGSNAFGGCYNLASVTLSTALSAINANTFYGCTALTSIEIPGAITYIYESAFQGCTALATITFLSPNDPYPSGGAIILYKTDSLNTGSSSGTLYFKNNTYAAEWASAAAAAGWTGAVTYQP